MPEATVNRATFCSHYTDKFDFLNALIASGFQKLVACARQASPGPLMDASL
jgi:hypothetical protein